MAPRPRHWVAAAAAATLGVVFVYTRFRRRRQPRKLRLITFGAPASGKGTQCANLVAAFGLRHISTGDLLRAEVKANTELGKEAKGYMDTGALVPDDLMLEMLKRVMSGAEKGWLLDGMPRTVAQAKKMSEWGLDPDAFIALDVPDDVLVTRVTGRRLDPLTGEIYHLTFKPPPNEEVRARLTQRSDDTEEKLQKRLRAYHSNHDAIVEHYAQNGKLATVDGVEGGADGVFRRVLVAVVKLLVGR
mmetsp:Transcript_8912/g.16078  ORF Transcript_8912/g.16078 Transcript_8912/m.16078 type:complete len:245 (+) Transcript_8912:78-812(+)